MLRTAQVGPAQGSKRAKSLKYSEANYWNFSIIIQCWKLHEGVPLRPKNSFFWTENIRKTFRLKKSIFFFQTKSHGAEKHERRLFKYAKGHYCQNYITFTEPKKYPKEHL